MAVINKINSNHDFTLLQLPDDFFGSLSPFLSWAENARLALTCSSMMGRRPVLEKVIQGGLRLEIRRVSSAIRTCFHTVVVDDQPLMGVIDGLRLANIPFTEEKMGEALKPLALKCIEQLNEMRRQYPGTEKSSVVTQGLRPQIQVIADLLFRQSVGSCVQLTELVEDRASRSAVLRTALLQQFRALISQGQTTKIEAWVSSKPFLGVFNLDDLEFSIQALAEMKAFNSAILMLNSIDAGLDFSAFAKAVVLFAPGEVENWMNRLLRNEHQVQFLKSVVFLLTEQKRFEEAEVYARLGPDTDQKIRMLGHILCENCKELVQQGRDQEAMMKAEAFPSKNWTEIALSFIMEHLANHRKIAKAIQILNRLPFHPLQVELIAKAVLQHGMQKWAQTFASKIMLEANRTLFLQKIHSRQG